MTQTITLTAAPAILRELEVAAAAEGLSIEAFILGAARTRAQDLLGAQAFFKERASRARPGAIRRFLDRQGGDPPREGDELPSQG